MITNFIIIIFDPNLSYNVYSKLNNITHWFGGLKIILKNKNNYLNYMHTTFSNPSYWNVLSIQSPDMSIHQKRASESKFK